MTDVSTDPNWPAWYFGPDNQQEIFGSEEEVPEGWMDHPSKVGTPGDPGKRDEPVTADSPYKDWDDAKVIAELKTRKIEFGQRWPRTKLESLLLANDKKGK